VQLLKLHYPVDDLLLGRETRGRRARFCKQRCPRTEKNGARPRAVAKLETCAKSFLAVHRLDFFSVLFFAASSPKNLRSSVRCGVERRSSMPFALAFRKSSVPDAERGAFVQHSFQDLGNSGVGFCQPDEKRGAAGEGREKRA